VRRNPTSDYNSNWKKLLEFRNMQEKLENILKEAPFVTKLRKVHWVINGEGIWKGGQK
jgi:hypothetical protein